MRWAKASSSAKAVASTAAMPARLTLLSAQPPKSCQGSSAQPPISGRNINTTGNTKPASTGRPHTVTAKAARAPLKRTGCASSLLRWPRRLANRMRDCARCSTHSRAATVASSRVANCAAAARLSITSQAL